MAKPVYTQAEEAEQRAQDLAGIVATEILPEEAESDAQHTPSMSAKHTPEPWQAFRDALLKCQSERDELLAVLMKLRRGDLHQRVRHLYEEAQAAISKITGSTS